MPEKDAELTALENAETGATENASAEAEAPAEQALMSRAESDRLQAEYEQLKRERDQLVDRLARLQAEFENARKRAEREKLE